MKIGLCHCQFETIHPFLDGNGRIGRLLITLLLCEQGVLQKPVLYLSLFFKEHRQEYYDKLQAVRDSGAWEEWLAFFLTGIAEVCIEATDTVRQILDLQKKHQNLINENLRRRAFHGHRILEELFEFPIISVEQVRLTMDGSYPAANNLVEFLVELGILTEITGYRRNRRFEYREYVKIFDDCTL